MAFCHRWRDCDKAACPKITSVRSRNLRPLRPSLCNFHPRPSRADLHFLCSLRTVWSSEHGPGCRCGSYVSWKFFSPDCVRATKHIRCFIYPLRGDISFHSRFILLIKLLLRAKHARILYKFSAFYYNILII